MKKEYKGTTAWYARNLEPIAGLEEEHEAEPKKRKTYCETTPETEPFANSLPIPHATKRQSIAHRDEFGLSIKYSSAGR